VAGTHAIHLNLGLRRVSTTMSRLVSEWTGLTVISTRTRNKILESAPWLASQFRLAEATRRCEGTPGQSERCLRFDNPLLVELRRRYANHPANDHIQWRGAAVEAQLDLTSFRADNLYLFQSRRYPHWAYYATAAYAVQIDRLGLLHKLQEDDRFGAEVFDFHGKAVSRDLLDSTIEINFLDRHLGLSRWPGLTVLDIGAGYGRLAHRMAAAFPNVGKYFCVDAVPESTFICDYYLKERNVTPQCEVVPLDELDQLKQADIAINIHSFAECRSRVVNWWLHRLREMSVPWLFLVSSTSLGLTTAEARGRTDFRHLIEKSGFELSARESKFESAPVLQDHGLYPDEYYLFRRR
jgi:putative sugar O-methyltransferase